MGSEDYFDWRESMERRQRESEQHVQSLLHETRRLKEENDKLCAQVSSSSPSHKRQPKSLWPKPIKTDLAKWDRNRRCAYHKDHGHTMKQCRNLHYLVERLIKVGHLKQYVCTAGGQKELA
ncbi:hypothetical protein CK203_085536 [Vitis vinifera]|uniref:Retrotransposon gag domain-containing protein n=1 Tax=Vitis vinifera TaxID=29760 RepID=A0A438C2N5_VITVI|nr:hypothetical protein CK203_085536 [Vitis vinifera]